MCDQRRKKAGGERVSAFLELVGGKTLFGLRGALQGRAVRSVPISVTLQIHHDWGYLPDALAARLVQNPVGAARSPPLHADPLLHGCAN